MRVSTLEHYSGAFRTMTNDASEIHLPGDSVDTFSMVLGYMLNRRYVSQALSTAICLGMHRVVMRSL